MKICQNLINMKVNSAEDMIERELEAIQGGYWVYFSAGVLVGFVVGMLAVMLIL